MWARGVYICSQISDVASGVEADVVVRHPPRTPSFSERKQNNHTTKSPSEIQAIYL